MKTIAMIFFILFYTKSIDLIAQKKPANPDTSTYDYAILRFQGYPFDKRLEIILPGYQVIDLKQKLKLDTIGFVDLSNTVAYQFIFPGIKYMDQIGYELVSSDIYGNTREYIFRRKKTK